MTLPFWLSGLACWFTSPTLTTQCSCLLCSPLSVGLGVPVLCWGRLSCTVVRKCVNSSKLLALLVPKIRFDLYLKSLSHRTQPQHSDTHHFLWLAPRNGGLALDWTLTSTRRPIATTQTARLAQNAKNGGKNLIVCVSEFPELFNTSWRLYRDLRKKAGSWQLLSNQARIWSNSIVRWALSVAYITIMAVTQV